MISGDVESGRQEVTQLQNFLGTAAQCHKLTLTDRSGRVALSA